ncbi:PREDICTED: ankyrin repeat-containing [Prunus dulcis]|uniref:PREDICTED: ankyrin repeat-containing n=1 Tax=Prunus dulcis TaxID=3755 RepID=A0A5E4G503_PRUDU|nr:PREDICTED: ankyrin repeat-containing [Prunus dulcis]
MPVSTGAVVVKVLNSRNYVDWSVLVKTYLLAQDGEEEAADKFKAWRKKNATALHTIQISCGQEAFSLIKNTTSAKRAWDTLAEQFKPKPSKSPVQILNLIKQLPGIAWELIQFCPQLVFTKDQYGEFPMQGFMPSAFLSGTRLKF